MDTTATGPATASFSGLTRGIREYSLFQAVLLVVDRLSASTLISAGRFVRPTGFGPIPSLGFGPVMLIVLSSFMNTG